jgi:hypothetical protein
MGKSPSSPSGQRSTGDPPQSTLSSFLKAAGEYKEFVALVAFFMGGIFWAFAYFATKEQLKQIQCIMSANMASLQGRMNSASLQQLLVENTQETFSLNKPVLTPEEMVKLSKLKVAAPEIARKLADAENDIAKALTKLQSGECVAN